MKGVRKTDLPAAPIQIEVARHYEIWKHIHDKPLNGITDFDAFSATWLELPVGTARNLMRPERGFVRLETADHVCLALNLDLNEVYPLDET